MGIMDKLFGSGSSSNSDLVSSLARSGREEDLLELARIAAKAANSNDMATLRAIRSALRSHVNIDHFTRVMANNLSMSEQISIRDALKRVGW